MLTVPQDYLFLTIFSLLRTLELIVDTMKTVKQEEERYRDLCSLLGQFQDSHSVTCLADRKRTLLWHGFVILDNEATRHDHDVPQVFRTQRLSKAINGWDTHRVCDPHMVENYKIVSRRSIQLQTTLAQLVVPRMAFRLCRIPRMLLLLCLPRFCLMLFFSGSVHLVLPTLIS